MSALVALLMLVFAMVWGSAFLLKALQDSSDRELTGRGAGEDTLRLQEAIDELSSRVTLLEEERDFYRELRAPDEPDRLESGERDQAEP